MIICTYTINLLDNKTVSVAQLLFDNSFIIFMRINVNILNNFFFDRETIVKLVAKPKS